MLFATKFFFCAKLKEVNLNPVKYVRHCLTPVLVNKHWKQLRFAVADDLWSWVQPKGKAKKRTLLATSFHHEYSLICTWEMNSGMSSEGSKVSLSWTWFANTKSSYCLAQSRNLASPLPWALLDYVSGFRGTMNINFTTNDYQRRLAPPLPLPRCTPWPLQRRNIKTNTKSPTEISHEEEVKGKERPGIIRREMKYNGKQRDRRAGSGLIS